MANIVVGSYSTEKEAVEAVRHFKEKGYKPEDLLLLTNRDNSEKLKDQTDVHIEDTVAEHEGDESFMDKIKRALVQDVGPEDNLSNFDKLISYGLSEQQAEEYARSLEAGNMIIIASETSGDSDRRTAPVADDNIDSLDRTGRTNLADNDVESSSAYQHITADDQEPSGNNNRSRRDEDNEEKVLDENPVLNKSTQERKGRSL